MRWILWFLGLSVLALFAYVSLWPVPIQAVAWKAPAAPGYTGPHAANERLARLNLIPLVRKRDRAHRAGARWQALRLSRQRPDPQDEPGRVGARGICGNRRACSWIRFRSAGNLIAADAIKGLLAISPDRKVTLLTDSVEGDPIRYADAVVVASTGKIYLYRRLGTIFARAVGRHI